MKPEAILVIAAIITLSLLSVVLSLPFCQATVCQAYRINEIRDSTGEEYQVTAAALSSGKETSDVLVEIDNQTGKGTTRELLIFERGVYTSFPKDKCLMDLEPGQIIYVQKSLILCKEKAILQIGPLTMDSQIKGTPEE